MPCKGLGFRFRVWGLGLGVRDSQLLVSTLREHSLKLYKVPGSTLAEPIEWQRHIWEFPKIRGTLVLGSS